MKLSSPEMIEGREAAERFDAALSHLMTVSRTEYLQREEEYQKAARHNPNRPGPKPKRKRKTR